MKRIISLALAICLIAVALTGCGNKREAFNVNLEKHITLADYKSIVVDKSSAEFTEIYNNIFTNIVSTYGLYQQVTTGTIVNGDIANIDYVGKIDGIEFEGGSDKGSTLTIGSGQFIAGFEEQLIGKEIGTTFDINVTFPNPYPNNPDLSGKPAVFTVTVNYVQKLPQIDNSLAAQFGFTSSDEFLSQLQNTAIESYIANYIISNSTIIKNSEDDEAYYDELYNSQILGALQQNYTTDSFKEQLQQEMKTEMVFYAILDDAELSISDAELNTTVSNYVTSYNNLIDSEQIKKSIGQRAIEVETVQRIVLNYLKGIVTIK